ncbi:MAG: methylated-DNA--[protein]-cysteine S-methyltransferase [Nitrospirota bacterium]|nr:methylated-DNA--[protein]-cysteine S-methyltransferase [Nitrospirota bacterium]
MKTKKSGSELFYDVFESPVGRLFLLFSGKNLAGVSFEKPVCKRGLAPDSFKRELKGYFEGKTREFTQSTIFLEGTDFEKKVWLALKEIPYGETRSYKWLAEKIGSPKASRAVGQALGRNPIPIVLPCHRIIESDGSIGGYSSGVDIKRRLLEIEYYNVLGRK